MENRRLHQLRSNCGITDKLSFDKNPALIIKGRKFVVNADAGTMLEIMGLFKEGSSDTESTIAAYEKLFSEKDRNEIKKMRLPFKDLMIIIQTAMDLIQGEEDQGEQ